MLMCECTDPRALTQNSKRFALCNNVYIGAEGKAEFYYLLLG